jgi:integrase
LGQIVRFFVRFFEAGRRMSMGNSNRTNVEGLKGVCYKENVSRTLPGKTEKVFYIYTHIRGKLCEEKVRGEILDAEKIKDAMKYIKAMKHDLIKEFNVKKLAEAVVYLKERKDGTLKSPRERRQEAIAVACRKVWTIEKLWQEYASDSRVDKSRYEKYLKDKFGDIEPVNLVQIEVERLKSDLSKKLKPQTVKHILGLLRRLINFGVNKGYCSGPAFKIPIPKNINNIKTEDLTDRQLKKLCKALDEDSNQQVANMMRLVLCTGMRRGKIFKLRWDDIDFDRGFIHIKAPKGGVDQKIPLNDGARKILDEHPRENELVFPGKDGKQRNDMNYQARRILNRAGLPKDFRPFHGLRHYFASHLASSGEVDMYTLQKLLTHKSPQMTQRYAHLRDEVLQKASAVAGNILNTDTEKVFAMPAKKRGQK